MAIIIDHDHPAYRRKWNAAGANKWNGAFFYSKEIVRTIIPRVRTDRNWITVRVPGIACDHAIVFVHNNNRPDLYDWLADYDDLVLVCGIKETAAKVKHLGKTIVLPLSIDLEQVQQYAGVEKTKEAAFVGRPNKRRGVQFPEQVDFLEGLPRTKLLPMMAEYKRIYGVGRVALEAKALGCKVMPYDERFPNPRRWKLLDNKDAAKILQEKLDKIDGGPTQ